MWATIARYKAEIKNNKREGERSQLWDNFTFMSYKVIIASDNSQFIAIVRNSQNYEI